MKNQRILEYIDKLQSKGRYSFTKVEALQELGLTDLAFKFAVLRLAKKKRVTPLKRGFFVIIPAEYRTRGILPAAWFIDDFVKFLKCKYYIGLFTAASFHGAAHQQPQEFQVVLDKVERGISKNGLKIRFFYKKSLDDVVLDKLKTETGFIKVSSSEETALDLIRYQSNIGGLNRSYVVIKELLEKISVQRLSKIVQKEEVSSHIQRLGFLIEKAGAKDLAEKIARSLHKRKLRLTPLKPSSVSSGFSINRKWKIIENTEISEEL